MPDALLMVGAVAMLLLAFALLALSQPRHWETVHGADGPPARRQRLQRWAASAAIVLALPPCVAAAGAGLGALLWAFLCFASAFAVALTLTWWPRGLARLAAALH